MQGPFYWDGSPELELGSDIGEQMPGEPAYYHGTVTDTQGKPIAGCCLDVWSGDGDGVYDMQMGEDAGMRLRAQQPGPQRMAPGGELNSFRELGGSQKVGEPAGTEPSCPNTSHGADRAKQCGQLQRHFDSRDHAPVNPCDPVIARESDVALVKRP